MSASDIEGPAFERPRRKPTRRYLLYRLYAVVAFATWLIAGPLAMIAIVRGDTLILVVLPIILSLVLPAVLMGSNLCAIPWPFSVFGPYERTAFPQEPAEQVISHSWARVGGLRATWPMVTWHVFPSGLGLAIELIGRIFIPWRAIVGFEKCLFGAYRLHHISPQAHSPIKVPPAVHRAIHAHVPWMHPPQA